MKSASKEYSSMQHREKLGAASNSSFPQSQLPSTEELNSRCGSRQSLLDTTSHRSHVSVTTAQHQYSNPGCTSSVVPSSEAMDSGLNRTNNQHQSPGRLMNKKICQ